LGPEVA
jgi:hypothetical protein